MSVSALLASSLVAGSALAASTHPKGEKVVLKKTVKPAGKRGPAGTAGPAGKAGANGVAGAQGAAGATGATGPAGAIGPIGPIGPSNLYFRTRADILALAASGTLSDAAFTIVTLNVPAGKYLISAKLTAWDQLGGTETDCRLIAGADDDTSSAWADATLSLIPMSMMVAHDFTAAGQVKLNCNRSAGGGSLLRQIKVSALKVGDITATVEP